MLIVHFSSSILYTSALVLFCFEKGTKRAYQRAQDEVQAHQDIAARTKRRVDSSA